MALKLSDAARDYLTEVGSLKHALANCYMKWYTGAQPATANATPTGTLLVTLSNNAGAITREVKAVGSVQLVSGGSGSLDTITVNAVPILPSAIPFNASLAQTAQDAVDAINNNPQNLLFVASRSSNTIILTAKTGLGALPNAWVVSSTVTTLVNSDISMAGGVDAVSGLRWGDSEAGRLIKLPSQVWSGVPVTSGNAGWFRFEAAQADPLTADPAVVRIDGTIAVSGAELNMGNLAVVSGVLQSVQSYALTLPTL